MVSYAQNGEDVLLERAFADRKTPGFYIDIGACHPVEDSITAHFYERGWRGLNVEPDPKLFETFAASRPRDINVNVAVDAEAGFKAFFPTAVRGHGTLDAVYAAHGADDQVSVEVPTMTLSELIDRHALGHQDIAFLKIDVEGWEGRVIAGMDWRRYRPQVVLVEAVDLAGCSTYEPWEANLLGSGYRFALFDGLNRFYYREEDVERLMPRLSAPANVRDNWVHVSKARLQQDNEDLSKAVEETARSRAHALEAAELSAVEADRARRETARALERERVAEEALARLETRAQVRRMTKAHRDERGGRHGMAAFFKRALRLG